MNDPTERISSADNQPPEHPPEASHRTRRVMRLLAGTTLLGTTAALPAFDTKLPPYKGD